MKLATFAAPGGARHIGVVFAGDQRVADLTAVDPAAFPDMLTLIDGGSAALDRARDLSSDARVVHDLAQVRLLAPIPVPRRIRDFMCFEKHVRQSRANRYLFGIGTARLDPDKIDVPQIWYEVPVCYKGNPFSVVGPDVDIEWPTYSKVIDYELEIGMVTARSGKNIRKDDAAQYIFGFTIFNDFSARDEQFYEMAGSLGPAKGKDFDTGNALGPWIVTPDELGDPQNLTMVTRVNGEEWSRGNSGEMHHTFNDIIAYVSDNETMYPGEILGSGTVGGGCGNELGRYLKHGDVLELEVSGIGTLRNRIVAPHVPVQPAFPIRIGGRGTR